MKDEAKDLKTAWINTPLGDMFVIGNDTALYLLEFITRKGLERGVERLKRHGFVMTPGSSQSISSIEFELKAYFEGKLNQFKTPYCLLGTPFQKQVWQSLTQIPFGETRSYGGQAASLGKPSSYRAVANANGANQFAIIVPCHRVIASDGSLGGYGGGLPLKQKLLEHEKQCHHLLMVNESLPQPLSYDLLE